MRVIAAALYKSVVRILLNVGFYDARDQKYASFVSGVVGPSPRPHQLLVDLGCGRGQITSLLNRSIQILGLDMNRDSLVRFSDSAMSRFQARAEAMPFRESSIDFLVAISLVEHLPNQAVFFREAARVLRPGGRGIFQIPELRYPIEPHTKWPLLHILRKPLQAKILTAAGYGEVKLTTSLEGILRLAGETGFEVEEVLPIWHFRVAKLFRMPMGYFVNLMRK